VRAPSGAGLGAGKLVFTRERYIDRALLGKSARPSTAATSLWTDPLQPSPVVAFVPPTNAAHLAAMFSKLRVLAARMHLRTSFAALFDAALKDTTLLFPAARLLAPYLNFFALVYSSRYDPASDPVRLCHRL
jgi:hypothetical protein